MRIKTKNMVKFNGEYHPTGTTLTVPDEVGFYLYKQGAAEPAGASEPVQAERPPTSKTTMEPPEVTADEQKLESGEQAAEGDEQDAGEESSGGESEAENTGEEGPEDEKANDPEFDALVMAAQGAVAMGKVIEGGKPTVKAMEEILKRNISAADRDRAWEVIKPPVDPGS